MKVWIQASRPKTLITSFAPALTGILLALKSESFDFTIAVATILCALFLQVLTNLANDYFDHKKGADTSERIGPQRVTASGLVSHSQMKQAITINTAFCFLLGVYLVIQGGFPILLIGILSVFFAIAYTAGPFPLAYLGLGEIFAFTFFGPVATFGSYYLQTSSFNFVPPLVGSIYGFLAVCVLTSNNLRDFEQDKKNNKKTLAVRFGENLGRGIYCFSLTLSLLLIPIFVWLHFLPTWSLATLLISPMTYKMFQMALKNKGREIIPLLELTAKFYILYALLLNASIILAALW